MMNSQDYSPIDSSIFTFSSFSLAFLISPMTLYIVLILFGVVYIIVTSVLMYHWSAYGMRSPGILIGETLFVLVSLILFMVASLAIYYF